MTTGMPDIAEIAALVGDPARANILAALLDGRALPASELAYAARVTPQTTSGHLAKLTDGRLISVMKQGRYRYYRLASPLVAQMLEGIMSVAAVGPARHRPTSKLDEALRAARTCYDHFAGKLGVALTDALRERGHLVLSEEGGEMTEAGSALLRSLDIDLAALRHRRRTFCRPCIDWTERRPHLGGTVGAAITRRCFELGWTGRTREARIGTITAAGERGFLEVFGLRVKDRLAASLGFEIA
jgi:DNA-binding transcriptional ArsR family regulator